MQQAARSSHGEPARIPAAEPAFRRAPPTASARPASGRHGDLVQLMRDGPAVSAQRQGLRSLFGAAAQFKDAQDDPLIQRAASTGQAPPANHTGLPDGLKTGVETLSGVSLDGVKVHYNSAAPARIGALAYAQGADIHLAPGQDRHLPHEAWHVVQQAQGRVRPTLQTKAGTPVNDDQALEAEADIMGARALSGVAQGLVRPDAPGPGVASVVQCVPDWMRRLIKTAEEHPIASLTAVSFGAAGVLAYYYWRTHGPAPAGVAPPAPDVTTVAGLAHAIGVAPVDLQTQLDTGVGVIDVNQLYAANILPWTVQVTGAVPPTLIAGLPAAPAAKVAAIFANLNAWPFNYTGAQGNAASGFLSRSGDCATLALMFQLACDAAGAPGVTIGRDDTPMLVPQHAIHGRPATHNTDGQACWSFDNHFWGVFGGAVYDLLFMTAHLQPVVHRAGGPALHNGVTYHLFADGRAMIEGDQFAHLTTHLTAGSQGYVAANAAAAQAYIDANRAP